MHAPLSRTQGCPCHRHRCRRLCVDHILPRTPRDEPNDCVSTTSFHATCTSLATLHSLATSKCFRRHTLLCLRKENPFTAWHVRLVAYISGWLVVNARRCCARLAVGIAGFYALGSRSFPFALTFGWVFVVFWCLLLLGDAAGITQTTRCLGLTSHKPSTST